MVLPIIVELVMKTKGVTSNNDYFLVPFQIEVIDSVEIQSLLFEKMTILNIYI